MNVLNSLKYFYSTCHFCGNKGLSISATTNNGEIAACDECSRRLIVGVSTALAELDRMNAERAATSTDTNVSTEPASSAEPEPTSESDVDEKKQEQAQ